MKALRKTSSERGAELLDIPVPVIGLGLTDTFTEYKDVSGFAGSFRGVCG